MFVDHFFPHAGNNHRPHLLRHRVLLGYSALLIALKLLVVVAPIALPSSSLFSSAITPSNIVALTNQARANLGLPELKQNTQLSSSATAKASDMLETQYFAHTSPAGKTPWDWIRGVSYDYRHAGENLAVHFHEAEDVQAGWMASPSHRANIVSDKYDEIGVGVATGTFEGVPATFVVQHFGRTKIAGDDGQSTERPNLAQASVASVIAQPTEHDTLEVRVTTDAQAVSVQLAGEETSLVETSEGQWEGELACHAPIVQESGEPLIATVTKHDGVTVVPAAIVTPDEQVQKLYIFNEGNKQFTTFFGGLEIGNLNDKVRAFYLGFTIFLIAGVLTYLFVLRLRVRHPGMVAHAVAVAGLAAVLAVV